jgi:hypothetical protein
LRQRKSRRSSRRRSCRHHHSTENQKASLAPAAAAAAAALAAAAAAAVAWVRCSHLWQTSLKISKPATTHAWAALQRCLLKKAQQSIALRLSWF